jgi:hypothetical protein
VWGQASTGAVQSVPLSMKDKIYEQEKLSKGVANSGFYRRMKLVMDYWCALWFWGITEADLLPSRLEFLNEVAMILGDIEMLVSSQGEQLRLFPETQSEEQATADAERFGFVDLPQLVGCSLGFRWWKNWRRNIAFFIGSWSLRICFWSGVGLI